MTYGCSVRSPKALETARQPCMGACGSWAEAYTDYFKRPLNLAFEAETEANEQVLDRCMHMLPHTRRRGTKASKMMMHVNKPGNTEHCTHSSMQIHQHFIHGVLCLESGTNDRNLNWLSWDLACSTPATCPTAHTCTLPHSTQPPASQMRVISAGHTLGWGLWSSLSRSARRTPPEVCTWAHGRMDVGMGAWTHGLVYIYMGLMALNRPLQPPCLLTNVCP